MPYRKPPSKAEMSAFKNAQKANQKDEKKVLKIRDAFRKKHDYYPKAKLAKLDIKKPSDAKKKQIGRKNLNELFTLGDLSAKIESERKKLVTGEWYIVPITYLIGELYKKGLRDFKGKPLEGDGGRFKPGSTREGWSVVYQLKGDKMVNVFRVNLSQLYEQALTSFNKPSEATDREMLIDDVFNPKKTKEAMKYLEERGNGEGAIGKSFDVKGIKHLRDVNLSKDKWAFKLGMTESDINKNSPRVGRNSIQAGAFNWRVPWANDGDKLLRKLATDANKKYVSENKDKLSKMTVKQLKEKVPSYRQNSKMKKADYVDDILERGQRFYGDSNDEWSSLIKNGR